MDRPRFRRYFRHGLLPQLIAFEACLRLGGVTRAAEELCLAQPTVSGLLKRLADTFGEPVLVARGGRMHVTAAGREVAALCDDIFASFERFEERRGVRPLPLSPDRRPVRRERRDVDRRFLAGDD